MNAINTVLFAFDLIPEYESYMTSSNLFSFSRADASRSHQISYEMDEAAATHMAKENGWRKAKDLKFDAVIDPIEHGWLMVGRLTGQITMRCVISDSPINFPIQMDISRKYIQNYENFPDDFSWDDDFDVDVEEMPSEIDLNSVISEALLLELPQYPKLAKYEKQDIWELAPLDEETAREENTTRPFANLREMLEDKKNRNS